MNHDFLNDNTPAGLAIRQMYRDLREDIEAPDGSWNAGDVAEYLCQWLSTKGFDVDGPNPFEPDPERCPAGDPECDTDVGHDGCVTP